MALVVSLLETQHYEDKTRTGWPGVRIMLLGCGDASVLAALETWVLCISMQQAKPM